MGSLQAEEEFWDTTLNTIYNFESLGLEVIEASGGFQSNISLTFNSKFCIRHI